MNWQVTIEPVKGKAEKASHDLPEAKSFPAGTEQIVFGREIELRRRLPAGSAHGRRPPRPALSARNPATTPSKPSATTISR